jgi:hypothetical protein
MSPTPLCVENVNVGVTALDASFPSGHEAPAGQVNCECRRDGATDEDAYINGHAAFEFLTALVV